MSTLFQTGTPSKLSYKKAVSNILRTYSDTPAPLRNWAKDWYRTANRDAQALATESKLPLTAVCHIIAALSPGCKWERNIIDARNLIRAERENKPLHSFSVSTYGQNKIKAWKIAQAARKKLPYTKILRGVKVTAFAENIEFPERNIKVTIDFHAYSVATGWRYKSKDVPNIGPKQQAILEKAYFDAAKQVGLLAHEIQSITWTWWRKKGQR